MSLWSITGFFAAISGWVILVYAAWRNQRAAKQSPIVETTNFGPRGGAIVEVTLHPERAATWKNEDGSLVFPNMGKDSSEIHGIRPDDEEIT